MGSQRFCEVIINSFLSRISSQWLRGTINSFLSSNVKVNRWLSLGGCHWISRWLSWGGYCCVSRWLSWGGCCWVSGWLSWGSCCWISRWLSWGGCCWVSRWLKYSVAKMYSEQTMASKCSNSLAVATLSEASFLRTSAELAITPKLAPPLSAFSE